MNSKKLYYVLLVVIGVMVIGLLGGAYGANILFQAQAKKLIDTRSISAALEIQQTQLTKAKINVTKYDSIGAVAKSIVPQDKNQAQTVRELVRIATDNGIKLGNISFPSSTLGASTAPSGSGGAAGPNLSQLLPVKSIGGVYTLQIIVQSDPIATIPYDKFINFLSDLEQNRRTALVSGITLQPDTKDPTKVSFTINLDEYVKP